MQQEYKDFVLNTPNLSDQYAALFVGTLPGQRYEFYTEPDYDTMKRNVLVELNEIDEALGFFSISS